MLRSLLSELEVDVMVLVSIARNQGGRVRWYGEFLLNVLVQAPVLKHSTGVPRFKTLSLAYYN